MTNYKDFKTREDLESYEQKLVNKYGAIKYDYEIIHNGYRLRRKILYNF